MQFPRESWWHQTARKFQQSGLTIIASYEARMRAGDEDPQELDAKRARMEAIEATEEIATSAE